MWWWPWLIGAFGLGLVPAYWIGRRHGWAACRDDIFLDIDAIFSGDAKAQLNSATLAELGVVWCYRNILNREPENVAMVRQWAEARLPRKQLAQLLMKSDEFQRQMPNEKQAARRAFATLK
jgi:hypothetical protein